jgi:hypothetical protein
MLFKYFRKPSECVHVFGVNYAMHTATLHGGLNTGHFHLIVSLNTAAVTVCTRVTQAFYATKIPFSGTR